MPWDVNGDCLTRTAISDPDSPRAYAMQLDDGDVALSDPDMSMAVRPGTTIYIWGRVGVPASGGAASLDGGVQTTPADRSSTTNTTVSIPLPGAGDFADFSERVTVPAGAAWGNAYFSPSGGSVYLLEVHATGAAPSSTADISDFSTGVSTALSDVDLDKVPVAWAFDDISTLPTGALIPGDIMGFAYTVPSGMGGSQAKVDTAPSGDTVMELQLAGTSYGSLTFHADGTHTFAAAADQAFAAGDAPDLLTPSSWNGMAGKARITQIGTR